MVWNLVKFWLEKCTSRKKIRNTFSDGLIEKGSKLKIEIHQNTIGNSNKYLSPTYIANLVIKYWGIYICNLNPFWILLLPIPFWVFDWCWVAVTKYNWLPAFFLKSNTVKKNKTDMKNFFHNNFCCSNLQK